MMGPLLVLTILLSPFALLVFLALRAVLGPRARPGKGIPDRAGRASP
ncbi:MULTISPECIES: hypothetical protein [unclassified Streptomyces]